VSRAAPRIFLAQLSQESGSFLPLRTDLAWFERHVLTEGDGLLAQAAARRLELAGALAAAAERGVHVVPGLAAWAMPWGPVDAETYAALKERLLRGLRAARRGGALDGVVLALHGAMQAVGTDDAEGDVLAAVRAEVGNGVPLGASLDLHANVTRAMVESADVLVAYHTVPHVDQYETGHAVMTLVARAAVGEIRPVVAQRKLPLVSPAETHTTGTPPMVGLMDRARRLQARPPLLSVSLCAVQPWLDVPELGWTVVAVADGDGAAAQGAADDLAAAAWESRRDFLLEKLPHAEVARRAAAAVPGRPLVVSDSGDNTSGGAPGDSVHLLRGLLTARAEGVRCASLLWLADEGGAQACAAAGEGGLVTLALGSKVDPRFGRPLALAARVERVVERAAFIITGPSWTGTEMEMGLAVVVTVLPEGEPAADTDRPPIRVVVCERAVMDIDPGLYRCVGEEPAAYQLCQVRSPAAFRAVYEQMAGEIVSVQSPGPTTSELGTLPWKTAPRPLFGLDLDAPFDLVA
jgi:microcystin degradation protein MlrC